jgi:hypothetical protein
MLSASVPMSYEILIKQQTIDAVVPKPQMFMSSSGLPKLTIAIKIEENI